MIKRKDIASFVATKGHDLLFPKDATGIHLTALYPMRIQGQCSRMHVLSTSYNLGNHTLRKDFALKAGIGNAEERIEREYIALKALKAQGIPVPTAIALEPDRSVIGAPFMIMEKINGTASSNFMNNKERALATVDMLSKLISSLHKVDSSLLSGSNLLGNTPVNAAKFRESELSELRDQISTGYMTSFSPLTRHRYLRAVKKLDECRIHSSPMTLIHADFGPDHVLLSNKGPVITDWEGIRIGDPAYDLGWLYHVVQLEGSVIIDHRFKMGSKRITFDSELGEEAVRCYTRYARSVPKNLEFYKNLVALKLAATLDLHVRLGYASFSRILRLKPQEVFSQTVLAYGAIKLFKRNCELFLHERNLL